jgi:hypothetical protein
MQKQLHGSLHMNPSLTGDRLARKAPFQPATLAAHDGHLIDFMWKNRPGMVIALSPSSASAFEPT